MIEFLRNYRSSFFKPNPQVKTKTNDPKVTLEGQDCTHIVEQLAANLILIN